MKIAEGTVIGGQYRVERRVGAGAMGEVWAGRRLTDGVPVALKVLLAVAAKDGEALARFRREAQILARVRSEFVSQVLDFLTDDEFGLTLVMELVPGDSLHVVLWREKKLPLEKMLPWAADVLHGLRDLHACGVIHRDLKPGNIIARPMPNDRPRATLIDFGVGRVMAGADEEELTRITRGDRVLGTLEYMAPEQILGSGAVTATADLYALGALFFRSVAGHHVFGNAQEGQLALAKLNKDPPPLPLGRDDELAVATQSFVSRLLGRRSRERFETTEQALAACEALVSKLMGGERARGADMEDAATMLFDATDLRRQAAARTAGAEPSQPIPPPPTPSRPSQPAYGAAQAPAPPPPGYGAQPTPRPSPSGHGAPPSGRRPPMQTLPTTVGRSVASVARREPIDAQYDSASPPMSPVSSPAPSSGARHEWVDEPTVERRPNEGVAWQSPQQPRAREAETPAPSSDAAPSSRPVPSPPSAAPLAGPLPRADAPRPELVSLAADPTPMLNTPSVTLPPPRRSAARRVLLLVAVLAGIGGGGWVGASYRSGGPAYHFITEWRARLLGPGPTVDEPTATGDGVPAAAAAATAGADAGTPSAVASADSTPSAELPDVPDTGAAVAAAPTPTRLPRWRPRPAATPSAGADAPPTSTTTTTAPSTPTTSTTPAPTTAPTTTTAPAPTFATPTEL